MWYLSVVSISVRCGAVCVCVCVCVHAAHNLQQDERTIDVHRLKTREAVRRTEIAIRDALVAGDTRLRVVCGRGKHSERGLPVLRLALTKAMEECVVRLLCSAVADLFTPKLVTR
jgi:Smr domain